MKKRLTIILAVALTVISCCALLIGCTPSKPSDYMTKWNESKNRSITEVSYNNECAYKYEYDESLPSNTKCVEVPGKTTTETTYIQNENIFMVKQITISNYKDKNGKDATTDDIVPTKALIYELNKDGKYNIYSYDLVWEKESSTSDKMIQRGKWTARQETKEFVETEDYSYKYFKEMFDVIVEENAEIAKDFDTKFKKEKGAYIYTEDGETISYKVKSGELVMDEKDEDGEIYTTIRYNLKEKITLSSGAKDALNVFLDTKEGVITKIEIVKDANVYTIKIEDKEYTVKSKVTGYDKLKDAKVDDVVSVRLKKGTFGGYSITEVFELV